MKGFKIGPLDPEATKELGKVSASRAARELLRRHRRLYPGPLTNALSRLRNEPRSKGLVPAEVDAAVRAWWERYEEEVPDGFKILGASVHGEDDGEQFVGYTYLLRSGRTGKGAVEYTAENFPLSYGAGTVQVKLAEAREAGVPVSLDASSTGEVDALRERLAERDEQLAEAARQLAGKDPEEAEAERDEEVERLREQLADAERKLADAAAAPEPTGDPQNPVEPWPGFVDLKVEELKPLLKDIDEETARRVVAFENVHGKRRTIIALADAVLDRPPGE